MGGVSFYHAHYTDRTFRVFGGRSSCAAGVEEKGREEEEVMVSVDVGAFLSRIERLYADWEVSKEEIERELFISDPCFL